MFGRPQVNPSSDALEATKALVKISGGASWVFASFSKDTLFYDNFAYPVLNVFDASLSSTTNGPERLSNWDCFSDRGHVSCRVREPLR